MHTSLQAARNILIDILKGINEQQNNTHTHKKNNNNDNNNSDVINKFMFRTAVRVFLSFFGDFSRAQNVVQVIEGKIFIIEMMHRKTKVT